MQNHNIQYFLCTCTHTGLYIVIKLCQILNATTANCNWKYASTYFIVLCLIFMKFNFHCESCCSGDKNHYKQNKTAFHFHPFCISLHVHFPCVLLLLTVKRDHIGAQTPEAQMQYNPPSPLVTNILTIVL